MSMKCSCDDARSRRALSRHLAAKAAGAVWDVVGVVCSEAVGVPCANGTSECPDAAIVRLQV